MGQFLAMSGLIGADHFAVEKSLASFATVRGGSLRAMRKTRGDPDLLALLDGDAHSTVLYPKEFRAWDEASEHLSSELSVPVFSFHIHDEDLWMFVLYDQGKPVDRFNPLPEYWDDAISEEERASWAGHADVVAAHVPGVTAADIRPYLKHWNLKEQKPGKAFPQDQFGYHDCWQIYDFMSKVGLKYPLDDAGGIMGKTYEFVVPEWG